MSDEGYKCPELEKARAQAEKLERRADLIESWVTGSVSWAVAELDRFDKLRLVADLREAAVRARCLISETDARRVAALALAAL